jgi:hypothetical protein
LYVSLFFAPPSTACVVNYSNLQQEKFEEDRYMKQQEETWKAKLRALREQEEKDRQASHQAEVVDPVKKDIETLLAKTGDKVSDAGLEALAKFRLDL